MKARWLAAALMLAASLGGAAEGLPVYVGTYTGTESRGIYRFLFDDATGLLRPDGLAVESTSPSFLVSDAEGRFVFAVNETDTFAPGSGAVTSFTVDHRSGRLRELSRQASGGPWPCHLALDATGRYVFVANYGGGAVVLPVSPEGRLSPLVSRVDPAGRGPTKRQEGPHAHGVYLDAFDRRLLVPDLGLDKVFVYAFDPASGRLTPGHPPHAELAPGAGPRHLAWSPDGRFVHVLNELDSTVASFAWDAARGSLEAKGGTVPTLPADYQGQNGTAEIAIHPSGRFLYASNRGHDSLAVFARDVATGALTRTAVVPVGGRTPRHFTIAPSGRWLLAAHQDSNTIAVFGIDPATGALSPAGEPVPAPRPVCLLFLPRGTR